MVQVVLNSHGYSDISKTWCCPLAARTCGFGAVFLSDQNILAAKLAVI
jgi:hypothetical protein